MDNKKTFVEGAFVLGIAGVIIKLMGFAFRIPLGNMIGDTGMGYYQAAYPIYVFLLLIAIAGIPIAISKMVSERMASEAVERPGPGVSGGGLEARGEASIGPLPGASAAEQDPGQHFSRKRCASAYLPPPSRCSTRRTSATQKCIFLILVKEIWPILLKP